MVGKNKSKKYKRKKKSIEARPYNKKAATNPQDSIQTPVFRKRHVIFNYITSACTRGTCLCHRRNMVVKNGTINNGVIEKYQGTLFWGQCYRTIIIFHVCELYTFGLKERNNSIGSANQITG
jgi:hypothetical protein